MGRVIEGAFFSTRATDQIASGVRCGFDPSKGITLRFTGQAVQLVGRNLNREMRPHLKLFEGLVRHRIPWIQEADEPAAMTAAKHATVIERVDFL